MAWRAQRGPASETARLQSRLRACERRGDRGDRDDDGRGSATPRMRRGRAACVASAGGRRVDDPELSNRWALADPAAVFEETCCRRALGQWQRGAGLVDVWRKQIWNFVFLSLFFPAWKRWLAEGSRRVARQPGSVAIV
jgi:hypothetical protein